MDTTLEFVMPGIEEPMLIINNPPMVPMVGDVTLGPDGTIYAIVQRAYIVEKPSTLTLMGGKQDRGRLVFQCVIIPVDELHDKQDILN